MPWRWMHALRARLRAILWRRLADDDLHDELSFHVAMQARANTQGGLAGPEAERRARLALGGLEQAKERARDARPLRAVDAAVHDLHSAVRTIAGTRTISLAIVATFALGVGANAAIFSLVHSVLLAPLPYDQPDRIVAVEPFWTNTGRITSNASAPDFRDWREQSTAFEVMAYHVGGEFTALVDGRPMFASVQVATPDFFRVFGAHPVAGRSWTEQDADAVAVVSHQWALAQFGDAQAAIGRSMTAAGRVVEIVGVTPPGFTYPGTTDIWISNTLLPETTSRSGHNYRVVGKLRAGVDLEAARAEMRAIAARLASEYPENQFKSVAVTPLLDRLTIGAQTTLWLLLGVVAGVLLIACVNVAHLQLVRAASRTREIAVRCAIGAGPGRVMRQVLAESVLLGLAGGLLGLLVGWVVLDGFLALAPADTPRLDEVRLDGRVFLFTLVVTAVCSVLFGLGPARRAAGADVVAGLQSHSGRGRVGSIAPRTRSALVIAEVAVSVVLLVAAGLLLRSFVHLNRVDLGFSTEQRLVTMAPFPVFGPDGDPRAAAFYESLVGDVRALPGVRNAAAVRMMPFAQERRSSSGYAVEGGRTAPRHEWPAAQIQVVTPGYFDTIGTPLRSGRDFADEDRFGRPQVAIVNERLVRDALGAGDPIGRIIRTGMTRESMEGMRIVGVVADARQLSPGEPPQPEIYLPYLQHPGPGGQLALVTHASVEPGTLVASIREAARRLNPEVPVRFSTMDERFEEALAYPRFRTVLVAAFALVAMSLALVGIYGVISSLVLERTPEIGVRLALGATPREIFGRTIGGSMRPVCWGLLVGLGGAFLVVQAMQTMLVGVAARDPLTVAAATGALVVAAFVASSVPALRAARLDPLVALRDE